jgi:hypothetical protein
MQNPQSPQDAPSGQPAPPAPSGQPAPPPQPAQSGGYGYPAQAPQIPHQGGYGYPQQGTPGQAEAQLPTQSFARPQQPPQPQGGYAPPPFTPSPSSTEPDWAALADQHEAQSRRSHRFRVIGIVLAACVLGAGVGLLAVDAFHGKSATKASGSPSPSRPSSSPSHKPSDSPTVPGQPNLLADRSGEAALAMGPDAGIGPVSGGYVLRLRSDGNSYAQSAEPLVDVARTFSISAWVYNQAGTGTRTAFSQGDGTSFSFDIGCGVTGTGTKYWFFSVQTAEGGADSTTRQVVSQPTHTVGKWAFLTATYDATKHTIALFVDGVSVGSTEVPRIWSGPGPFQVGRNRHHGMWDEYWNGVIGHIQVWDSALSAADVAALKDNKGTLSAKPLHSWLVG